ncbi:NAD(P)-dependent oxidoreductase [Nonomuraea antri]|uniref:NAD(P)-dependent oxidoreductase n=1 Tax=Nonomuraea antri TaxID=2730852 RepID=UPI001F46ECB9|nr:NAD(P)-binding domain-containing protein [Nonomuraea antri]
MTPVTIIGLGAIGTAVAKAYLEAGHPTTVWNRTPARAAALEELGAVRAATVQEAVAANTLIITAFTGFEAAREALEPAAAELAGRTLVTLNSGSPAGARETAAWAAEHGVDLLAGAIKNVPSAVGLPDTLLYYGGAKTVFDRHEATLRVMGGDTVHLGEEPDLAAVYELAVGGMLLPALLGFFQGAALVTSRGLEASTMVRFSQKWLEMIVHLLPSLAETIDTRDYDNPESALGLFHEGIAYDHELGREGGIDVSWQEPMHDLLRRAVAEGRADQSIAALIELLRKP